MLIKNEKFVLFSFAGFLLIALSFKGIDKVFIPNDSINIPSISSDSLTPDSNKTETPIYIDPLSYDTTNLFSRCWNTRSTVSYSSERKKGYSDSTFITLLDADTSWAFPVDDKFNHEGRMEILFPHKISTWSPFFNLVLRGLIELFILTPIQLLPISVCKEKAKSKGIAPIGRAIKSPLGEKTKT